MNTRTIALLNGGTVTLRHFKVEGGEDYFSLLSSDPKTGTETLVGNPDRFMIEMFLEMWSQQQDRRRVRHYKGGEYTVDPVPVKMQVSEHDDQLRPGGPARRIIQDGDEIIVYRNAEGMAFGRFPDEFNDPNRFEDLA